MNQKILFNTGWKFAKSGLEAVDCNGLNFEPVDLPHDWLIYNTLNLYENSIGWYRKDFTYKMDEKQVLLYFDGVYMDSTLYVNGKNVGEWKYGYSSFEHDITDSLKDGENEILLKVVYQHPNSRWYTGAGIYRNVWLKVRDKTHFVTDGIYVSTQQKAKCWQVDIDTELTISQNVRLSHRLLYKGEEVAASETNIEAADSDGCSHQSVVIDNPLLWSPENPNLYQLVSKLYIDNPSQNSTLIETISQNIGFRNVEFHPEFGLRLNGKKYKLNGVCEHHDLGALGSAFNKAALKRRFELLKEMGVNAIRTAHNMPAPELMNLADEMGFLIDTESFDTWERSKNEYDYSRFFKDWFHKDLKSWVKRDRNHPSLLMWSIGNEIYDTHAGERGQELTKTLMACVKEYDSRQNGRVTFGSNYMPWENTQKCADIIKIPGYNYGEKYYQKHHEEHPDWIIYGSETSSTVQSRGIYHFPFEKSILSDDDEQCSSLGNSSTSWGAKSTEACIQADRDKPFSCGQFIWSGFDYIGEPTPYHTKNSYFGQLDTATFPKDSYYIYQAEWTDYRIKPMIHIFPYWDFSKGQLVDVRVCSNAPKIELQFNGTTVGTQNIDHAHGTQLVGCWKLPYTEGELKAIAYDEYGKVIATEVKKSFGNANKICLRPDRKVMEANGTDLVFVEITMQDANGNPVENADNRVKVQVTGAGRLVGLDSGDSTDYDQYKGLSKRLFSGKLMAIVASTLEPGKIQMTVSSIGLEPCHIEFEAVPAANADLTGISASMCNAQAVCVIGNEEEIPLRKIEIESDFDQINPERKMISVQAKLYPENATYKEVEWSAVNDGGIPCTTVKIEADGLGAKITALSDGKFRIRCTSKNGTEKTRIISELDFEAVGLGTALKDPYEFICAGLYDYAKGEVTNGNERGVATARDGETQVGFRDIDFGHYGSDRITIPIFALSDEEYPIEIWEGMPDEAGSSQIANVNYQKHCIWNVYQEETYQLSKRLNGVTSICFVLRQKVHIKGFSFARLNRAFEQNMAADSEQIYGDTFTINENFVEGIGNNVSIGFEDMDFTSAGASKIVIYGRTNIEKNTIHIRFANEDGESNQIVEFLQSNGYTERVFNLEKVTGKQKVAFIFLPGCNFDFGWFRFEE